MAKKRKKIFIITALALLIMIAIAVTVVFAYNTMVDYNYNFDAHQSVLTANLDGGTTVNVDRNDGQLTATESDIILVSANQQLKLAGQEAAHTYAFTHIDGNTYYKYVFTNMPLTGSRTSFSANAAVQSVLHAVVSKATYNNNPDIKQIVYENRYVSSMLDLELLNFQSNYNNIFELAGNYYGKVVYARTIFFLADLTFDNDFVINQPCSINILNSVLTLNANLTLHHSYAGQYFLENTSAGQFTSGTFAGSGEFTIKTPKAYYKVNDGLKTQMSGRLIEIYDFDAYGDLIFSDALDFAQTNFPDMVFSDFILQQHYQSFGIAYDYYIVSGQTTTPFYGKISVTYPTPVGSLYRGNNTTAYTIRIVASKNGEQSSRDIQLSVVGRNAAPILNYLADRFTTAYYSYESKIFSAVDLLPLLSEIYTVGSFTVATTISIEESASINITDENAAKLMLNGMAAAQHTVTAANITGGSVSSFFFRRGTVTLSDLLTVKFTSGSTTVTRQFNLAPSNQAEVIYYLKSSSPAFTTNTAYGVINIGGESDTTGIYIGNAFLTASNLGVKSIVYNILTIVDSTVTVEDTAEYFEILNDGRTLKMHSDLAVFPENLFLQYTCTFDDNTEKTFLIRIIQSIADDGGGSQQFESINPFDQLFMNTDVNWLEGGTFEVPSTAFNNFAGIEILSIDGITYNPNNPYNMCYIKNNTDNPDYVWTESLNFSRDFYKIIDFVTDLRYVPDRNSVVKVKCTYYSSSVDDVVLTQEYVITINGIFKCGNTAQTPQETPFVFVDQDFYDMTIELFDAFYEDAARAYVSTFSTNEKYLLSDSKYADIDLDYSDLHYSGSGIDTQGIQRLTNIPLIRLDGIRVINMSSLEQMVGSALKTLSLANCKLSDSALYATGATESYLYEIQLHDVNLSGNSLTRTDNLLSRTVSQLDISNQEDGLGQKTLVDIAGLDSIKNLRILDISNNAIYRFEVLKKFDALKTVYLYGNRTAGGVFGTYGTDGLINVPHYVWLIKTSDTKIYANANDLSDDLVTGGFIKFGADTRIFSAGGNITDDLQEGSVALNAFASPTRLYSQNGKIQMEKDIRDLKVQLGVDGSTGGLENGITSSYEFKFTHPQTSALSDTFILIKDYQTVTSLTLQGQPIKCSYIVTIEKITTIGGITTKTKIAMREFVIDVHYDYLA